MTKIASPILFLLLPLLLSGCFHRRSAPPLPPQAQAPPVQQQTPVTTAPVTPQPQPATPPPAPTTKAEEKPEPPKPTPKPKRPAQTARRTKPPASKTPDTAANATTTASSSSPSATAPAKPAPAPVQQAAVGEGNGAMGSPIGQLTSGDTGNSAQKHKEALQTIENTTQGVNNLKRSLSEQEQETVVQIKTFLKQAKQALNAEDVDGALNLANKAKVLLTELTK